MMMQDEFQLDDDSADSEAPTPAARKKRTTKRPGASSAGSGPKKKPAARKKAAATSPAPEPPPAVDPANTTTAKQVVANQKCPYKPGCRGKLKRTPIVTIPDKESRDGFRKVHQLYCSECGTFAPDTVPADYQVSASDEKLFDRYRPNG